MTTQNSDWLDRARDLHRRCIVIDSHCDTTARLMQDAWDLSARHHDGHVDLPRLREGGVSALFLAVYAPKPESPSAGVAAARAQLDRIHATIRRFDANLQLARSAAEAREAHERGKIAILIAIEGGYLIGESLDVLREFRERGAVYMTLTHGFHTAWADSSGVHDPLPPQHGGLTAFGCDVVREMNRLGMMVDVSHVSDDTFRDVIETSSAPVIASHSSCRAVSPHRRNLSDDMMRAIAAAGGVVQINFASAFVDPTFPPIDGATVRAWRERGFEKSPYASHVTPLETLVDHFDHALRIVGPDYVGIGSDFDGVSALPKGMEDCSKLPHLTAALLRRGYGEAELAGVLGANILRVMDACDAVARRPRSVATITDQPSAWDSLPFAVEYCAASHGLPINGEEFRAVLGLPWLLCAAKRYRPADWAMMARDFHLVDAARLFGLQLREIHPPEAARGLDRVAEFEQHFDASYRPLILRALEHRQAVLAWQGWPGERAMSWGIITEACAAGVGFRGVTTWSPQDLQSPKSGTLSRPPIQLYVVERIEPRLPTHDELLQGALAAAKAALNDPRGGDGELVRGPQAFEHWIASTQAGSTIDGAAQGMLAALETGIRFLARYSDGVATTLAALSREMREALRQLVDAPRSAERLPRLFEARSIAVRMREVLPRAAARSDAPTALDTARPGRRGSA